MVSCPRPCDSAMSTPRFSALWSSLPRYALALLLAVGSFTGGFGVVLAQAPDGDGGTRSARKLFQAGVGHFEAGRYAEALGNFEQAYRLKPHPSVQVNIANCYDKLKRPVEAIEHFELFMASPEGSPAQRTEVESALARLTKQVARLVLRLQPASTRTALDEQADARRESIWVGPGKHRLTWSADGYQTESRSVEPQAGEVMEVTAQLVSLTAAEPEPIAVPLMRPATPFIDPPPAPEAAVIPTTTAAASGNENPDDARATRLWISGSATLLLGVTAVITGQLALAANEDFDINLRAVRNSSLTEPQRAGAWARGRDASDRAEAFATTTDILLLLTLAGAGLTTYFYLSGRPSARPTGAQLSLQAGPGAGRVQLRAQF